MHIDAVLIFEPEKTNLLYPFSIMHPLWEIRCGALRIFEKIKKQFPDARLIFSGRDKHLNSFLKRFNFNNETLSKENILIYHSAILPTDRLWNEIISNYQKYSKQENVSKSVTFSYNQVPFMVFIHKDEYINPSETDKTFFPKTLDEYGRVLPTIEVQEPKVINYLWDAIYFNGDAINDDSRFYENQIDFSDLKKNGVHLINESSIKIAKNTKISPGVVIDASDGYVIIDDGVSIMPNAVILGPCYIGKNSSIKIGAKIYANNSFGEFCKVGGEIESTIIQSFSNKQHDGFLGHSFISEWVNLGANTNNSNLKNTYSQIKVRFPKQEINTGKMFLGLLCGDHTKTAINTSFNTGTVSGIAAIIIADGMLPNYIPSFAWRGTKDCSHYKFEKAIDVAKIVMARRNKSLTNEEIELLRLEYEIITNKI